MVGCVRLVPPVAGLTGITDRVLGPECLAETLASLEVTREQTVESSRWIADPDFRALRVGVMLAAGAVATARALGFKLLFCAVGTRDKQDRVLSRLGLRRVPGIPLVQVPAFDDELCVMYIYPESPPTHLAELMAEMDVALQLKAANKMPIHFESPAFVSKKSVGSPP
jgi:hypothetical protein